MPRGDSGAKGAWGAGRDPWCLSEGRWLRDLSRFRSRKRSWDSQLFARRDMQVTPVKQDWGALSAAPPSPGDVLQHFKQFLCCGRAPSAQPFVGIGNSSFYVVSTLFWSHSFFSLS